MPAGFGDRMRKAQGTRVYLYDYNGTLLCIFDSMEQAAKCLDISTVKVNGLLTDNNPNRSQLLFGSIALIDNSNNQKPTMTFEQVTELVLRYRTRTPAHFNKGRKMTEAQNLAQAINRGTPIDVYDVNRKLITTHPSIQAAAKALGIDHKTIERYVKSQKLFRGKFYFKLGKKGNPNINK